MTAYEEYLKSNHWKAKRKEALEFYGFSCVLCGKEPEHVHHRRYNSLWQEDCARDLIVLCAGCHEKFHTEKRITEFSLEEYLLMALTEAWNEPDRSCLSG